MQKIATKVILGSKYTTYSDALEIPDLPTLSDRRLQLCKSFAKKTVMNPKFDAWFQKQSVTTRTSKEYVERFARTEIYKNSPLLYLTRLLNDCV